jgi:hypothetical protein
MVSEYVILTIFREMFFEKVLFWGEKANYTLKYHSQEREKRLLAHFYVIR